MLQSLPVRALSGPGQRASLAVPLVSLGRFSDRQYHWPNSSGDTIGAEVRPGVVVTRDHADFVPARSSAG